MSVYSDAASTFRDTTKWLVAFVPVAALVSAAAVVGPRLLYAVDSGDSPAPGEWIVILAPVLGVALVVFGAIPVLRPKLPSPPEILDTGGKRRKDGDAAMSDGVGEPYVSSIDELKRATQNVKAAEDPAKVFPDAKAVAEIHTNLRDWVMLKKTASRFTLFGALYLIGILLIGVGVIGGATVLKAPSAEITEPTVVEVELSTDGLTHFKSETGCDSADGVVFVAVGGTWDHPTLRVKAPDGNNCNFGAEFEPDPGQILITKPAA
jgi:hypothetical protein